ncbi:hypothetical protein QVO32_03005 [Bacteroides gallinaceum]|uniref:hypothetical protein n=1 Tax=Bacteroides gallinaceum TaxID=1462571 RepID=UPI0025AAD8B6|nr:hypothetical protein [Bacteroides gallinaceum]MDN0078380.1 hypothetical protein [Bacteroides gallinaceum]
MKLVVGVLHIINREAIVIDTRRFCDDCIHQRAEAECRLTVAELRPWVDDVTQGCEVGVGDLCTVIVFIWVMVHSITSLLLHRHIPRSRH